MSVGPHGYRILDKNDVETILGTRPAVSQKKGDEGVSVSASIAKLWDTPFTPFNRSLLRDLDAFSEDSFYSKYFSSYRTNPFTFMLVEYVVSNILGYGYHFEGSGAVKVEDFFAEDDTRNKLESLLRCAVIFGNGLMDFETKARITVGTRVLPPPDILIVLDSDPKSKTYGKRLYYQAGERKPLDSEYIFHFTLKDFPNSAYGMSLLRPNIVFLQGLLDSGGDVLAAIKRVGYAPIVAKLDLDGYRTQAEKEKALEKFAEDLKKTESADQNFAIDRRHDINLLGAGSAGARLLPINDLIEPWIAVSLRNFGFPIGVFLQQGANKAIVDAQREDVRVVFHSFRDRFKNAIETKVIPWITNRECKLVWNKPPPETVEMQGAFKLMLFAYQLGIVSKEYILKEFDIEDDGKEFYEGAPTQGTSHDLSS